MCAAARERGVSLEGVCFVTLGEPFTEAKRRVVQAAGARALVRYAITELGIIGYGCGTAQESDDVHFFSDSYGLIQRPRSIGECGLTVDAFYFTSLLRSAPKVVVNLESGDFGRLGRRSCDCALGSIGLQDHISEIRSFEKLSGEGMTFATTDLLHVLEERLPARFGGSSSDYQLIEQEDEQGILRLHLIVSPSVRTGDDDQIRRTFLDELGRDGATANFGAVYWERAGTVEVRRRSPIATRAGKILPFHLLKSDGVAAPNGLPRADG